jgi:hypothetical protein
MMINRSFKIKINKVQFFLFLMFFGVDFFPITVRKAISSTVLGQINVVSCCGLIGLLYISLQGRNAYIRKSILSVLVLTVLFFGVLDYILQGLGMASFAANGSFFLLPFLLLLIDFRDEDTKKTAVLMWYRFLSIAAHIICFTMLIDLFFDGDASEILYSIFPLDSLLQSINEGRSISYYGHPLTSKTIAIIYYLVSNAVDESGLKKVNKMWCTFVCLVCVLMSGSKGGILLFFVILFVVNFKNRRIRYFVLTLILMYVLYLWGLFDVVLERFSTSATLTTGRLASIALVLGNAKYKFYMLRGTTTTTSSDNTIGAFSEMSVFWWAYRNGILNSILKSIVLYAYPVIMLLKRRNIRLLLMFGLCMVEFNTSNYICSIGDGLLVCVATVWTYLMISTMSVRSVVTSELRR